MTALEFRYIVAILLEEGSMNLPYVHPQDLDSESISLLCKFFNSHGMLFSANYVDSTPNLYTTGSCFPPSYELRFSVNMEHPTPESEIPIGMTDTLERSIDYFCAVVDL